MTDDAGLPALLDAIRHLEGCEATWVESVPIPHKNAWLLFGPTERTPDSFWMSRSRSGRSGCAIVQGL